MEKLASALNNILQFLFDSKVCFDKHIQNVNDDDLKRIFKEISESRQAMIADIHNQLLNLGIDKAIKGTVLGKLHMIFENIKSFLTEGDPIAITKEVRRGENVLIDYYKQALILQLAPNLKTLLLRHMNKIEDDIKKSDLFSVKKRHE